MLIDPALRTLYRLVDHVDGEDLQRVQAEIARRRARLEAADMDVSPLSAVGGTDAAGGEPSPPRRFTPLDPDEVPQLVRRPGESVNRVAPRATG